MGRLSAQWARLALVFALSFGASLAAAESAFDASSLGLGALEGQIGERQGQLAAQRAQKSALDAALAALPERQRQLEQARSRDVRVLYRLRRGGLLPGAAGLEGLMRTLPAWHTWNEWRSARSGSSAACSRSAPG